MPSTPFAYAFAVPFHDIDAAGILFYGHLFRHAHDAYEQFMKAIGFPLDRLIRDGEVRLPLVHAEADYAGPLRHGDAVTVHLCVAEIGRSAFTLAYRFTDAAGGLRASARTVHVHLRGEAPTPAPLPADLVAALRAWQCEAGPRSRWADGRSGVVV